MKKVPIWPAICVFLITAVSAYPLLGLPVKGDDLLLHYYRIAVINAFWEEGVFFSRWAPELIFGFGSPLFNFYPPLSAYLLTVLYWVVGANGPVALNLFFILSISLSSVGMYLSANKLFGSFGAVLSTAVFCWSPYLLLQTYSRSSLSNALALALFPWAFWALLMLYERLSRRWVVITALFVATIFLSHVVSSILFIASFALMGLVVPFLELARRATRLRLFLFALLIGVGLSAFFGLPAFSEIGQTKYAEETAQVDYADFFADAWQWPERGVAGVSNAPLPKSVGLVQQLAGIVALIGTSLVLLKNGRIGQKQHHIQTAVIVWFCCAIGLAGLFLTTEASNFIWQILTPLQGVQFPWRLLDIPVFWLAFGLGWLGSLIQFETRVWQYGAIFVLFALMVANATSFLSPPRTAVLEKRPLLSDASKAQQNFAIYGLTAWGEYSFSTVDEWPSFDKRPLGDNLTPLADKLTFTPNEFQIIINTPWKLQFNTTNPAPIELPLFVHYFPGWRLRIDDQPAKLAINAREWLVLDIPQGSHTVTLVFGQTTVRAVGNVISWVAVLVSGLFLLGERRSAFHSQFSGFSNRSSVFNSQQSPAGNLVLALLLSVVLIVKLAVIDRVSTPLLRQTTLVGIHSTYQPMVNDFGELSLVGSEVIGDETLVLYWHADEAVTDSYRVLLTLVDGRGVPIKEISNLHPGFNRTKTWEAGQLVRDVYSLSAELAETPVAYDVLVGLEPEFSDEMLPLQDSDDGAEVTWVGMVKRGPVGEWVQGDTAVSQNANFNDKIQLTGLNIPETVTNHTIQFDLIWQSVQEVDINYTVFVHLLSEDGEIIEQSDGQPTGGVYPTSAWSPNEQIIDSHQWVTSAPPGKYRLQIGLYDLQTGARLPVTGEGALGDRVIIVPITIE